MNGILQLKSEIKGCMICRGATCAAACHGRQKARRAPFYACWSFLFEL